MLFNSIKYLIFLAVTLILYFVIPKKYRWIVLLVGSYAFYIIYDWRFIFLLVGITLLTYGGALLIDKFKERIALKRLFLILTLVLSIGVLVFFKYLGFLNDIFNRIVTSFNPANPTWSLSIILPIGISFYIFQTTGYVIDVYRGEEAEKHLGYYALFASFFCTLLAGPISRRKDLLPQLKAEHPLNSVDFAEASRYLLVGYFKKIAVADVIGIFVAYVYAHLGEINGLTILVATVMFAFQIYCDFSGYSDIAVGSAKLFGINLTENFKEPYKATSIKDFWNRWHLSLSTWFRDYIYFPMGGSRVNKFRWAINIMVVFLVSGLWHGANWTFIVWGALHGALQIIGRFTLPYRNKLLMKMKLNPESTFIRCLRIVGVFLLVDFCWIFFVSHSISDAGLAITKIFSDWNGNITSDFLAAGCTRLFATYSIIAIAVVLSIENIKYIKKSPNQVFSLAWFRYATYVVLVLTIIGTWIYLQTSSVESSFIYFEF